MSESLIPGIKIKLPNKKELVLDNPQSLKQWIETFIREWRWLEGTPTRQFWQQIKGHLEGTWRQISEWERYPQNPQIVAQAQTVIQSAVGSAYHDAKGIFWDKASLAAIEEAKAKDVNLAAGLLVTLAGGQVSFDQPFPESFFAGIIRGFLFKNEIDWTASAHRTSMQELEAQARVTLIEQEARLRDLESENNRLNQAHQETLSSKDQALESLRKSKEDELNKLHEAKDKAFGVLAAEFERKFQAIKKLYTDELALRAPVDYWEQSRARHVKLAKRYAWATGIVLCLLATGLGFLIQWAFGTLQPDESPKHWEVGVVVISTFFTVWIIRLIVRLFLSHQHLATDAEQKVTMVKTFLALGKEEGGVAKDDRAIILQQLFKSAADGLIKEDGTPPGWIEYLSRSK